MYQFQGQLSTHESVLHFFPSISPPFLGGKQGFLPCSCSRVAPKQRGYAVLLLFWVEMQGALRLLREIGAKRRGHLGFKSFVVSILFVFCVSGPARWKNNFGRLVFIHHQCWEVLPFCRFQRQRCIKIRVLRAQDFYTPLALKTANGQHLPALVVYKNQSLKFAEARTEGRGKQQKKEKEPEEEEKKSFSSCCCPLFFFFVCLFLFPGRTRRRK